MSLAVSMFSSMGRVLSLMYQSLMAHEQVTAEIFPFISPGWPGDDRSGWPYLLAKHLLHTSQENGFSFVSAVVGQHGPQRGIWRQSRGLLRATHACGDGVGDAPAGQSTGYRNDMKATCDAVSWSSS